MTARTHGKYFSKRASALGIPLVAPEGGWGWAVALAYGICHVFLVSVVHNFSLIFSSKFDAIGMTAADVTVMMNINAAVCNGVGLLSGPVLKRFSCREVALFGSFLLFSGALLSSLADTYYFFIISIGVVFGSGLAFLSPASLFSINSYFIKQRSRGMGLAMAIGGIGTVFMPLVLSSLLQNYSSEGTMLIVAALVLHCVPAALLLQPVRWHMVPAEGSPPIEDHSAAAAAAVAAGRKRTASTNSVDVGYTLVSCSEPQHDKLSEIDEDEDLKPANYKIETESPSANNLLNQSKITTKKQKSFWIKIVDFFDLRLFKIIPFALASSSMSFFAVIETNFMLLIPYLMLEIHGYTIQQIAGYQSVVAAVDIIFRFVAPYIGLGLNLPDNLLYILSIIFLSLFRALIMIYRSYNLVLVLGVWFGMCRGIRSVFAPLLIPSFVPVDRLPAALGLLMAQTAIAFIIFGPFVGMLTNSTKTLADIITGFNLFTVCSASLWVSGMTFLRMRANKKQAAAEAASKGNSHSAA
ncbi:monocarboxylate transporter 1-like [Neocloeon triangulifer]|uniref:monocarboxylate transporter 1-like n=1 Tax=Neocloeon triangulifer TaxID=2078957 RepID=UPI00286F7596|nr:monocarboxylate transporter 1-like [Neocloeon triangulifer]XP_059479547.1 monocarboxylate transporter 1-like [Neocloeon triangulifer]XP_059479548.1 monocarboxylate transporter 1-like [Neocloeon triangulifer]